MAQSDRFYFWREYWEALAVLPTDAQRGRFVMELCAFAFEGREPEFADDPQLAFAWAFVRGQVRRSIEIGRERSKAGKRSGETRRKGANSVPNSVPNKNEQTANSVPNDMNRYEYGGFAPSQEAQALAADSHDPNDRWAGVEVDSDKAMRDAIAFEQSLKMDGG